MLEFQPFDVDIEKSEHRAGELIPLLQNVQNTYGYISEKAIEYIGHVTGVPAAEIYGVVTFYAQFRTKPLGEKIIKVCNGTACHVNSVKEIANTLTDELGINYEETTEDGKFSMVSVACLGCCSLAPVIMVTNETFGRLTPQKVRKIVRDLKRK
jgi:NADH-quinone oxidoreductase subunit E